MGRISAAGCEACLSTWCMHRKHRPAVLYEVRKANEQASCTRCWPVLGTTVECGLNGVCRLPVLALQGLPRARATAWSASTASHVTGRQARVQIPLAPCQQACGSCTRSLTKHSLSNHSSERHDCVRSWVGTAPCLDGYSGSHPDGAALFSSSPLLPGQSRMEGRALGRPGCHSCRVWWRPLRRGKAAWRTSVACSTRPAGQVLVTMLRRDPSTLYWSLYR